MRTSHCSRSAWSAGVASSSGRFAGVTAQARMSFVRRSVARCCLYPLKRLRLLFRPCRISGSSMDTRRSSATPRRRRTQPFSISRSCLRTCASASMYGLSGSSVARLCLSSQSFSEVNLSGELLDRLVLLLGIIPVDIEPGLDTRRQEQRNPRLPADLLAGRVREPGGAGDELARSVAEQIERIFNPPGSFKRAGIDRQVKILGQLLPVEFLRLLRQLDRPLQQPSIQA